MSIEAMKQAIEVLEEIEELRDHWTNGNFAADLARKVSGQLRTAIQQAEAKTDEPVVKASDVMMIRRLMKSKRLTPDTDEGWEEALRVFTHPAPGVPDDVRIAGQALANIAFNLAQNTGSKIEKRWADSMREAYKAWDAAMLSAK